MYYYVSIIIHLVILGPDIELYNFKHESESLIEHTLFELYSFVVYLFEAFRKLASIFNKKMCCDFTELL